MSQRIVPADAKTLRQAQDLIRPLDNWCQGASVKKTGSGYQFCAIGSLSKTISVPIIDTEATLCFSLCAWDDVYYKWARLVEILQTSSRELYDKQVEGVNDSMGHEHVMHVFDHAINKLIEEANANAEHRDSRRVGSPE